MENDVFGTVTFNVGWEREEHIDLFGKRYSVFITAAAYYEKDGITLDQENSFRQYKDNNKRILRDIEDILLKKYENATDRFLPKSLLFQRNGVYALILDDKEDEEGGIVVSIERTMKIMSQDEYL